MTPRSRIVYGVTLALLMLVASAGISAAKGPTEVTVSGPGVADRHLTYTEETGDVNVSTLGRATRIYHMFSPEPLLSGPGLTPEELGPRYVLTWWIGDRSVVQHVYPFADGGGWARFPRGQRLWEDRLVRSGWIRSASDLESQMVALGARDDRSWADPDPSVSSTEPPPAEQQSTREPDGRTSYDLVAPAGIALAVVLACGLAAGRRLRAQPRPDTQQ